MRTSGPRASPSSASCGGTLCGARCLDRVAVRTRLRRPWSAARRCSPRSSSGCPASASSPTSLQNLDLPVIMACVLYAAFFVVLANAVVDVLYAALDPRVRPCLTPSAPPRRPRPQRLVPTRAGSSPRSTDCPSTVRPGEVLGIVGESGSGKSVAMSTSWGSIHDPNATFSGSVRFGAGTCSACRRASCAPFRGGRDRHDLPGPDDLADPGLHRRLADRGADPRPRAPAAARRPCAGGSTARRGRHPGPGPPGRSTRTSSPAACGSG